MRNHTRTTKVERRAARLRYPSACQWIGTAAVARLMRTDTPTMHDAILLSTALSARPDALIGAHNVNH